MSGSLLLALLVLQVLQVLQLVIHALDSYMHGQKRQQSFAEFCWQEAVAQTPACAASSAASAFGAP